MTGSTKISPQPLIAPTHTNTMTMPALKRSTKNIILSTAIHSTLLATLWFSVNEMSTPEPKAPEIIDATILPAVETKTPADTDAPAPIPAKESPAKQAAQMKPIPNLLPAAPAKGENKPASPIADNGVKKPAGSEAGAPNAALPAQDGGAKVIASKPLTNSVPVAVQPIGGFSITYDATASKGSIEQNGGAKFVFNKNGSGYTVDLQAQASVGSFGAHSEGEIRGDTIATTRFKDWRKISFLGMGSEKTGSNFIVSYPEKSINFGGSSEGTKPLEYSAVYDYLSAMVYLQALLQQHPSEARAGRTLSLPIGKRTEVQMATVTFKSSEDISTYEGRFDNAIPANINIPSGSIKSLDVWFIPEKNYRPLQIEMGFTSGKVKLISRSSN